MKDHDFEIQGKIIDREEHDVVLVELVYAVR